MPIVNEYSLEFGAKDKDGNVIVEGPATIHTDQHHDAHGGTHTQTWTDHIHEILKHPLKAAMDGAGAYGAATLFYRNIKFTSTELRPYTSKVVNLACRAFKTARG